MKKDVEFKLASYPSHISPLIFDLRELIQSVALELNLGEVEESLKWGELSYSVAAGSPVRIDWKKKSPVKYSLFFNCNTKLVATFRELYRTELSFQGNREIELNVGEDIPRNAIRHCVELAFQYQKVKHLPLLGA